MSLTSGSCFAGRSRCFHVTKWYFVRLRKPRRATYRAEYHVHGVPRLIPSGKLPHSLSTNSLCCSSDTPEALQYLTVAAGFRMSSLSLPKEGPIAGFLQFLPVSFFERAARPGLIQLESGRGNLERLTRSRTSFLSQACKPVRRGNRSVHPEQVAGFAHCAAMQSNPCFVVENREEC